MTGESTIKGLLEAEHRWVDGRFDEFAGILAAGHIEPAPFLESAAKLHRHIYLEEEALFPALESRGMSGPVAVMAMEHGEICRYLGAMEAMVQGDAPAGRLTAALKALRSLLEEHNFKEERVLYPAADDLLQGAALGDTLARLRSDQAPPGWTCRAHRGVRL